MNESWAIGRPGHSLIGTRVRLLSSSVSVPFQPGSQKPAVAWTISPRRPSERLALDAGDDVVRQLDPFLGAPEAELAGVDDERLVLVDDHLLGEVARRVAQVDRGHAVVVEDAERVAEPQVDAGRLDHRLVPRVDADPALLDERADGAVGEDGGRLIARKSRTEGRALSVRERCVRAQPPSECWAVTAARLRREDRGAGRAGGARAGAAAGGSRRRRSAAARPPRASA